MFHVILVHPEIPPNTGNVIRLCANTGCNLHLIEPLGFEMDDRLLRRAGLDYHEYAPVRRHKSWQDFQDHWQAQPGAGRLFALTTRATRAHTEVRWQPGDGMVFGSESAGLPEAVRAVFDETHRIRLPMRPEQRSLNLSNAVSVTVFEAWRQSGFSGAA